MPYKSDKKGVLIPRELKRNVKISMEEREEIRLIRALHGYSYNAIAMAYGVSKRLIQFICDTDKEQINRERRKRLGKDGRYYNREYHKEQVRETRRYKHILYKNKKTIEKNNVMKIEEITKIAKEDLYGALVEFGADPYLVETEEQAVNVLESIENGTVYQITDPTDYETARRKLDLTDRKSGAIYGGVCESSFTICFAENWDF